MCFDEHGKFFSIQFIHSVHVWRLRARPWSLVAKYSEFHTAYDYFGKTKSVNIKSLVHIIQQ